MAFKQVADGMTGDITGTTFQAAANTADINLPGMIPAPMSFKDEWTQYPALLRMINQSVVYSTIKNGDVSPLGACGEFDDVSSLVENAK